MMLLLLEDDELTRMHVLRTLVAAGHAVDACGTGEAAHALATTNDYAVLILDRMVPGTDGLSLLKQLRSAGIPTPAIMLTAMDGISDRVEGLEGGADDYLVKPFAATELVARVAALARRSPTVEQLTVLRVGSLELDLLKRAVTRDGRRIELQAQEMKLLEYLMRHTGEVVTRTMMLENIWSFHFDPQTNLIESHMSRLRAKIDRGFDGNLIQTVRGAGYRIEEPAA